ncbi:ferrous iron transporter B [Halobacillus halophilus]|uniref:FeoB small GTPase domain-containing protein n=1 Tax=Halobacillus halophilus TaxID=1570 RepID=UPI001370D944|nr:FeoB small GTPase domain-containing protein [Halobacillus halophilus]MYL29899.1 ferrous iron transporter B [Halobacillus halophilus]
MLTEQKSESLEAAALAGLESVGKTALFRHLTGHQTGVETNVKGSTVTISSGALKDDSTVKIFDTPGIRFKDDSVTTRMALNQMKDLNKIILVVKASNLKDDLLVLEEQLGLRGKNVVVIATHSDKYQPNEEEKQYVRTLLNVPVVWCNSRSLSHEEQQEIGKAVQTSSVWELNNNLLSFLPSGVEGETTNWLEKLLAKPLVGPVSALFMVISMFAGPVFAAYLFSSYLQPISEKAWLNPVKESLINAPDFIQVVLIGNYGALTLGWYSFLWAFPVVFLIGLSVAVTEETGIQEHITYALNPWLMKIGLSGRDLIPVLTGFGCNVVAVMQSRTCSSCTRASCISLISFGSACSYQIGASLSLFGSAGHPLMFIPYIFLLFIVGAVHTRIWEKRSVSLAPVPSLPYLQSVTWRGVKFRLMGIMKQFLKQAMPIFIVICIVASLLEFFEVMKAMAALFSPLLTLFSLPAEAAPGVIFSIFRKDGMMVLNEGEGALLHTLETWQVFVVVYLASTLSSCLVTLFFIYKEMGLMHAFKVLGKQMTTSVISTLLLAVFLSALFH